MIDISSPYLLDQVKDGVVPFHAQCGLKHISPDVQADRFIRSGVVFFGQQLPEPADQAGLAGGDVKHLLNHFPVYRLAGFRLILVKQIRHLLRGKILDMQTPLDVEWRSPQTVHPQDGFDADQRQTVKQIIVPIQIHGPEKIHEIVNRTGIQFVEFIDEQDDGFGKECLIPEKICRPCIP